MKVRQTVTKIEQVFMGFSSPSSARGVGRTFMNGFANPDDKSRRPLNQQNHCRSGIEEGGEIKLFSRRYAVPTRSDDVLGFTKD